MKNKDSLYAEKQNQVTPFRFDKEVADVFDDMLERSVPGYRTTISMIGLLAERYSRADSFCYDLGCSLGAATLSMRKNIKQPGCSIIAVDNSKPMIEKCRTQDRRRHFSSSSKTDLRGHSGRSNRKCLHCGA